MQFGGNTGLHLSLCSLLNKDIAATPQFLILSDCLDSNCKFPIVCCEVRGMLRLSSKMTRHPSLAYAQSVGLAMHSI